MNIGSLEETFQIACSNGQPEIVENLLQNKNIDLTTYLDTSFQSACVYGRLSVVKILFEGRSS